MGRRAQRKRSGERAAGIESRKHDAGAERLARQARGGAPDRPLEIESPSQVEAIAETIPCPVCGAAQHVLAHEATTVAGTRLRVARMRCNSCAAERALYFALHPRILH